MYRHCRILYHVLHDAVCGQTVLRARDSAAHGKLPDNIGVGILRHHTAGLQQKSVIEGARMLVYVLDKNGQPLMPTSRCGKVRRLLKTKQAVVVRRCPFVIRLMYDAGTETQPVTLGVDAGSVHIGLSATTETQVLYEADVRLRTDITDLIASKREARRSRRSRLRYREPRFDNRSKPMGWLAPSVQAKVDSHLQRIGNVHTFLPITEIVIEVASFDIQKIKDPDVEGTDYQQGEQLGFWNVREYVLFRDGHTCQCCHGKTKDPVLNVHHIESRKTGGDAPNNLITLCETCHKGYHAGTVTLPKMIHRGMRFRNASFMGIMRWAVYNRLKELYPTVRMTYGYITKNTRIRHGLTKDHYIDARCISGHPDAKPFGYVFYQKKVRCHNRKVHKSNPLKGGRRKLNQAPYEVKGFRLWDKVRYNNEECFVTGRRSTGYFVLKKFDGATVHAGISCKKLTFVETAKHYITERKAVPPVVETTGFPAEGIK